MNGGRVRRPNLQRRSCADAGAVVPARRPARGAATVEFTIVALVAVIPMVLGTLQLGLLYVTKHTVQHATYLAARAGAVDHARRETLRRYFAKGLVPLYARTAQDLDERSSAAAVARAYAEARLDASRPDRVRITLLNPTVASFDDFERVVNGVREIPNRFRRDVVGVRSRQTLADANVLALRVDYCAPLVVPFVDRLLTSTLRSLDPEPFRQACYAQRRLPVAGRAIVQMHTAARRDLAEPA